MCAKDLKDIAAMWLEELNISGDTIIDMNHDLENLDPNLRGSYNLFDLLDLFVDHVREGEELKKDADKALILSGVSNSAVPECLKHVVCPQCKKEFKLTWNDYEDTPQSLIMRGCPSGGIYDVSIKCPNCDYEEDL